MSARAEPALAKRPQSWSPNNRVQRAGSDKVHGRGRVVVTPTQVMCARVLNELRPVADAGRYAAAALKVHK
jgi:hypothetical protein